MKKFITLAIALLLIIVFAFTACKNNRTEVVTSTTSEMSSTEAITNSGYLSDFPTTNFVSSNAKKVFKVIDNDKQQSLEGYKTIINFLNNTSPQLLDSNQVWKLGDDCFLILNRNRMLILSNSTKIDAFSYVVLDNVDYRYTKSTPNFLNDYNQDISIDVNEWIVDDMTYSYGKFFYFGNKLFEAEDLKAESRIRLLGCSSSSDGTNFIAAKDNNKIWLIKENNHEFEFELIATDAVDHSEQLSYPMRNDCYKSFYNNDAVQYGRTIIYRSINGGLVQLDILNDHIATSKFESENPVLVYDYSGVFWLQIEDFGEIESLYDLIKLSNNPKNHPKNYVTSDGVLKQYTLCDY